MTSGRTKPEKTSTPVAGSSVPKGFMDDMLLRAKEVAATNSPSKMWLVIIGVGIVAVIAIVGLVVLNGTKKVEPYIAKPVMTVTTVSATTKAIPDEVLLTGSIWPWDPTQIACEVGNLRVQQVNVEEGSSVSKGQVLATLNSSVLRAQLAQAEARLGSQKAALVKARQPNRVEDIAALRAALSQADAGVSRAQAALVQAKHNYTNLRNTANRAISLAQDGAISAQEAETRDTSAKVAQSEIYNAEQGVSAAQFARTQAQEKLNMAVVGGRREDILIAQATVAEQQAEVQRLRSLIEQTIITAPDDGLVTRRLTHVGDTPQVGAVLFRLARQGRLELRAAVPEKDLLKVAPGLPVQLQRADGKVVRGVVSIVVPEVDPDTRLGLVRVTVPANQGLVAGMFVKGSLILPAHEAIVVPSDTVIARDSRYFVFILDGNKVVRTPVTLGARNNEIVEIKTGLKPGEQVVMAGAGFLKDGDLVSVSDSVPTVPVAPSVVPSPVSAPPPAAHAESR